MAARSVQRSVASATYIARPWRVAAPIQSAKLQTCSLAVALARARRIAVVWWAIAIGIVWWAIAVGIVLVPGAIAVVGRGFAELGMGAAERP